VVTGSEDGKVFLYDLNTRKVVQKLTGHASGSTVISCSPHPQGRLLASAAITETDHTIILWSRETDKRPLTRTHTRSKQALAHQLTPYMLSIFLGTNDSVGYVR
jgi:WD40 repeat protein